MEDNVTMDGNQEKMKGRKADEAEKYVPDGGFATCWRQNGPELQQVFD
jgi:hypothetical protein